MTSAALAIVLSLTTLAGVQATVAKELVPLQGTWEMVSVNGREIPTAAGAQALMTFTGNTWVMNVQERVAGSGTMKVDASVTPMAIDMLVEVGNAREQGKTQLGIFEVKDGTLRMNIGVAGGTTRPADFTQVDGSGVLMFKKK